MKRLLAIALLVAACSESGTAGAVTAPGQIEPTGVATPEPTPAHEGGTGRITFGTAYDPDTLEITTPFTKFKRGYPAIAWSADLTHAVGPTSITLVISRQSTTGVDETIVSQDVKIGDPDITILANVADLASLVDNRPGTYVMRYVKSVEILAAGSFTLVE